MNALDRLRSVLRGLSPETRCLLVFVPLACVAVNAVLPHLPGEPRRVMTTLHYTALWLAPNPDHLAAAEDSWKPMRTARAWLAGPREGRLYQDVFFERGVKLQYPPTSLLWLDALALLPGDWTSNTALNAVSWLAVLLTAVLSAWVLDRCARGPPVPGDRLLRALLAVSAGIAFYPLVRAYYLGQVQTWIDALVAAGVLAFVLGRTATSGASIGLACLIKPQLGVLLLWALLRGHRRFALGFAAVAGSLGLLSLALYGLANHVDYLNVLSYIGRHGESFHPNQSVNGLVQRLLGNGNNLQWRNAFPPFDARVYAATLASSAALLGAALLWRRRDGASAPVLDLAVVITSATLASPVAWTHHYGVLLPLFAVVLPACLVDRDRRALLAGLAVSFLLVADTWRIANRLADTPWGFLQSYVLFGGLLFLALLYRLRAVAARSA